jgi:hypothetical protein
VLPPASHRFLPPDVTNAASTSGHSIPSGIGAPAGDHGVVPGGAERAVAEPVERPAAGGGHRQGVGLLNHLDGKPGLAVGFDVEWAAGGVPDRQLEEIAATHRQRRTCEVLIPTL